MQIPDFKLEKVFIQKKYNNIIGIDEVGRGPLAGPVVACSAMLRDNNILDSKEQISDKKWDLVRDSKKLSEKQREEAFNFVMKNFHVGVGICDHNTIDRINILESTYLAMKKSISELKIKQKENKVIILVDGNKEIPNLSMEQKAIVGGDRVVKSIAAASIIAKVTRDRLMKEYDKKWPEYSFAKHKGYGTKIHMEALVEHGPCEIHRKSFAPVKRALKR
jgi:ribonuclease HII